MSARQATLAQRHGSGLAVALVEDAGKRWHLVPMGRAELQEGPGMLEQGARRHRSGPGSRPRGGYPGGRHVAAARAGNGSDGIPPSTRALVERRDMQERRIADGACVDL